jgi:hypothetical protein
MYVRGETALRRLLLAVLALVSTGAAAYASELVDLYRAQAIVTGTAEPERTRGFRAGLVDLVVKLTGDARLADDERLRPLLEQPHRFIERFNYEDRLKGLPVHDEQGTRERPYYLRMRFKAQAIDDVLARLGLARWPAERPTLAVWLRIETAAGAYVLSASGPEGYGQRAAIVETAERRGVPIVLPEADGSSSAVSFDDIAANDTATLSLASPGADAVLAGVLSVTENGYWDITWRFAWRNQARSWTLREVSFDAAFKNGLEIAALIFSGHMPP